MSQRDEWVEKHRARLLEVCEPNLFAGDDGYVGFWPCKDRGFFSAYDLRVLADEIDRRNEPWDKIVQEAAGASDEP